jgi:hypothetical protein
MRRTHKILTGALGVLGLLLLFKGAYGGVWPPSVQFIAGALLLVYAVFRWRVS